MPYVVWRANYIILDALIQSRNAPISFVTSVCPSILKYQRVDLRLEGFQWNLILGNFSKTCRENPNLLKVGGKKYQTLYISVCHIVCSYICNATMKIMHCGISTTTISIFIELMTATYVREQYKGTENNVTFSWQQWIHERATTLDLIYVD